jgi:molybdate transport system substrate-binding protein
MSRRRALAVIAAAGFLPRQAAAEGVPVIAVAASLRPPLEAIVADFRRSTGQELRVSFGATGTLARQIEVGAPFELLLAADADTVERLVAAGYTDGPSLPLVRGRLVLAAGRTSAFAAEDGLPALGRALEGGGLRRFAIANPELAPYGRAARETLERTGYWERVRARLVVGESIGQAAQFVASGGAEAGLLALSTARSPEMGGAFRWSEISDGLHRPIDQRMAILKRAGRVARAFAVHLGGASARAVFERAGFALP